MTYISDSIIYNAVKREERRIQEDQKRIKKEREEIFNTLTHSLKNSEKEYIKSHINNYDLMAKYIGITSSYVECIKSSIEFCKNNQDMIEKNFGHYNDILTKEEKMLLGYNMIKQWNNKS